MKEPILEQYEPKYSVKKAYENSIENIFNQMEDAEGSFRTNASKSEKIKNIQKDIRDNKESMKQIYREEEDKLHTLLN